MIRLQDESGNWIHEVNMNFEDETYYIDVSRDERFEKLFEIDVSRDERFAKLFEKDDPVVKDLVDNCGFEIVE